MTNHELTFSKIKEFLESHFPERISEYEDGTHLTLDSKNDEESSIWIELDEDGQLTVGFGISHLHYDPKYDDLNKGFNDFLRFLTCKKRRIDYYKGKFPFKNEYEFENENGTWENYGTSLTWAFPFWKKTTKKTTNQNGFINITKIESEIEKIKSTMHNTV
ncbi:hypothetical protein [Olleya namhaensis]|uniref:Uncharacterized protein n=1 Tax=Olleya namhaensis TaxID=1144750 RepID=A0A1I3T763_9FLAO|nr:hypothetical protein [Olleya namhaensis]SFJ66978.1 hypothetical protein SAMN05443431_1162 [Olleya namhaensis]